MPGSHAVAARSRCGTLAVALCVVASSVVAPALGAGELVRLSGLPVLRLSGTPRERGRAHGRLLAREISGLIGRYIPLVAKDRHRYQDIIRADINERFAFPKELREEVTGLFEGLKEALGEDGLPNLFGRRIDELDLLAIQALPDWYPFACSAFVAWGKLSGGGVIVGRNMDFFVHPVLLETHLLIVHERSGTSRAHVSLGWPGLVGTLTGMNEDGVCACILDAAPILQTQRRGLLPRMAAARLVLEKVGPGESAREAFRLVGERPTLWGGCLFVAGPDSGRLLGAAGVIETDAFGSSLRLAWEDPVAQEVPAFACTNHFRVRQNPEPCPRYDVISEKLSTLTHSGKTLDETGAFAILRDASQPITMQAVVMELGPRTLHVRLATPKKRIDEAQPLHLSWEELAGPHTAKADLSSLDTHMLWPNMPIYLNNVECPGMRCPYCRQDRDKVIDSRACEAGEAIRRRRECLACNRRFTTYERVEESPIKVVKRDGTRRPFDKSKIRAGIEKACSKLPISANQIDAIVNRIEQKIVNMNEREVPSRTIGEMVMEELRALNHVAYVRFASVYREFKDVSEFLQVLQEFLRSSGQPASERVRPGARGDST